MADYKVLIPQVKKYEGGFSTDKNDPGNGTTGCTNSGVTLTTYRSYFGSKKTCVDLKRMTAVQWEIIFKKGYWDRWKADYIINQSVANILVDWVWMSGANGIKKPQEILGVKADGVVGSKTLAALNSQNQEELFNKIWQRRKQFFEDIVKRNPSQKRYLKGWMNRLNSFKFSE